MEIEKDEYVGQLYAGEINAIIKSLIAIEHRLTELKLDRFAFPIKAIVVALEIEEMGKDSVLLKGIADEKTKELAKSLLKK